MLPYFCVFCLLTPQTWLLLVTVIISQNNEKIYIDWPLFFPIVTPNARNRTLHGTLACAFLPPPSFKKKFKKIAFQMQHLFWRRHASNLFFPASHSNPTLLHMKITGPFPHLFQGKYSDENFNNVFNSQWDFPTSMWILADHERVKNESWADYTAFSSSSSSIVPSLSHCTVPSLPRGRVGLLGLNGSIFHLNVCRRVGLSVRFN